MSGEVVYRVELLAVLLSLGQGAHLSLDEGLAFMDREEFYRLADATEDDRHLVNACLELEAEMAERNWKAVERLLAHGMFGEEEVDDQIEDARARGDMAPVAADLLDLMDLGLLY